MIKLAEMSDLEGVLQITHETISEIYSHYYAQGVVEFFLRHHSRGHVLSDIEEGIVWVLEEEGSMVGTVTIKGDAVNRLFVLPSYQSKGYGSHLMDFAENKIAERFSHVHIDSSLAAKEMYLKRGYREKKTCRILTDNGDILIYDEMGKRVNHQPDRINYDGKIFIPQSNTENGELDFHYQHMNKDRQVRIGKCHGIPHILENGKIALQEKWQWLNGDLSSGESMVVEK